jgi:hypothetical protein
VATSSWPADALRRFGGLEVVAPSEALVLRSTGDGAGPIVVRGHLKLDAPDGSCDGGMLGPFGPWCVRSAILAERAWAVTGVDADPMPVHLHVTLPLGVRAPDVVVRMAVATAGPPIPVVVVGRFVGTPCAPSGLAWCGDAFVVDRVAWADGVRAAITPLAEDPLETGGRRPNPLSLAIAPRQTPLLAVLAWPDTIARLDPATARAAWRLEASEPVWYLRVIEGEGRALVYKGRPPAVRWTLLDERTLTVLATGDTAVSADKATVPAERPAATPFPDVAADLGVRLVGATRAAVAGGVDDPVAVAGYLRDVRSAGACTSGLAARDSLCLRLATLDPRSSPGEGGPGIQLRIPPGVRLPPGAGGPATGPVPVVILARPRPGGAGCDANPACVLTLEVDRVAWAAGEPLAGRPVVDPDLRAGARDAARGTRAGTERLAAGPSGTVLVSALVSTRRVADLDPVAAAILESQASGNRAVWYVRALETQYGSMRVPRGDIAPRVSWVVADARTGEALAWGAQ